MADSDVSSVGMMLGWRRSGPKVDHDGASVISNASTKGSLFGKTIMIENENSSDDDEDVKVCPREFIIQCKNDEMVFVTVGQGKKILKRCWPLKKLVLDCCQDGKERIIHQPDWEALHVRRMIAILITGSAWIENDATAFAEFYNAAMALSMDIRLTSLINFQDELSCDATRKFFQMVIIENYQFKISAILGSSQWLQLLKMGILLMSKSRVLSVRLANYQNNAKKRVGPSEERLTKCDNIYSEYCVYAHGNMQTVWSIVNILTPPIAGGKHKAKRQEQEDEIKLIFLTRKGALSYDDMTMLWRMTDSSFIMSTQQEQAYLDSFQAEEVTESMSNAIVNGASKNEQSPIDEHSTHTTSTALSSTSIPNPVALNAPTSSNFPSPVSSSSDDYQCRTLSGKSFLAFKHLFGSINTKEPDLAACLMVRVPTPDTLGRLINATRKTSIPRLDFDLQDNAYFACKTSTEIKKMLAYMSDYSSSAVVDGDFQLCQHIARD